MISDGGGLYLFVRTNGAKEWILRYTSPDTGKRRKQSLGPYSDISLQEARDLASERRKQIHKDIDPLKEVTKKREKKRLQRNATLLKQQKIVVLVFDLWLNEELVYLKDKGKEINRMFKLDVMPLIGTKPIDEVTRQDIKDIVDRPKNRFANRTAKLLLTYLRQFFRYAEEEELVQSNVALHVRKNRLGGKLQSRKRVLNEQELYLLKDRLPVCGMKEEYQHAIWLFLATGCRNKEIINAPVNDFDLAARNFHIPSERSKNTDPHNIYLSDFAIRQFEAIAKITKHKLLFPDQYGELPLEKGAFQKQIRLRQLPRCKPGFPTDKWKPITSRKHNNSLELLNGNWTTHDLRRTAATIMQQLGVMPHIIKKCLNQRMSDPMMETYQRAELKEEQKQAFILLGNYLSNIMYGPKSDLKELFPINNIEYVLV